MSAQPQTRPCRWGIACRDEKGAVLIVHRPPERGGSACRLLLVQKGQRDFDGFARLKRALPDTLRLAWRQIRFR